MTIKSMNKCKSTPVSVSLDCQGTRTTKQILKKPTQDIDAPLNPLDWYTLTETTGSILNELMAYTSRERRKERKKAEPDADKLKSLSNLFEEVHDINREPANFKSASRMEAIIAWYAPMVRKVNKES